MPINLGQLVSIDGAGEFHGAGAVPAPHARKESPMFDYILSSGLGGALQLATLDGELVASFPNSEAGKLALVLLAPGVANAGGSVLRLETGEYILTPRAAVFTVVEVRSISGARLWEVQRVRDGQTISEPFTSAADCREHLGFHVAEYSRIYA